MYARVAFPTPTAMPVYEFTCESCGRRFDKLFRSMSDRPAAACPACGSAQTRRALSLVYAGERKVGGGGAATGSAEAGGMPFCGRCGGPGPCGMQ